MSSVTNRINLLRKGLVKVLRRGRPGEVVFCRCLNRQDVLELGADPELSPSGWSVCVVTDRANGAIRAITSDRAVELREEKGPPVLLLVDADHAGAGMDGIYSAGREIDEAALFKAIDELAKRELNEAVLLLAHEARRLSRKLYGRSAGARWDDLDFLASLVSSPESFGKALSLVGLWPIDGSLEGLGIRDIDSSMRLVQKLLLGFGREQTAGSRVRALFLKDATEGQRRLLEQMVEEAATKSIPDVVRDIAEHPTIWLNCIKPGFLEGSVQRITLKPWRNTRGGGIAKWSGLQAGDPLPEFILPIDDDVAAVQQPKLEVRFEVRPEDLRKGGAEYRVVVLSGERELASRNHTHQPKPIQTLRLTNEDFQDIDDQAIFEAHVIVGVIGTDQDLQSDPSDLFVVRRGELKARVTSDSARFVRCLAEGAIFLDSIESFDLDCQEQARYSYDESRGHIVFRPTTGRLSYKVPCPRVAASIERLSVGLESPCRWIIRVRNDGEPIGDPEAIPLCRRDTPNETFTRLSGAWRRYRDESAKVGGSWGRVYAGSSNRAAEEYVLAWSNALEAGDDCAALMQTLEVRTLADKPVGLVVLPSHPLRVAWHSGFDQLARHMRYDLGIEPKRVVDELKHVDGSYFPAMLPGLATGQTYVFADTIGFYGVAMVTDDVQEPRAAVALLRAALGATEEELDTTVGTQISDVLAEEMKRYVAFHSLAESKISPLLKVHAIRPGDGASVARALGVLCSNVIYDSPEELAERRPEDLSRLRFELNLYPADPLSDVSGQFMTRIGERYRSGTSGIQERDRWMVHNRIEGMTMPRLRWARRADTEPIGAAHMSVSFDIFDSKVICMGEEATTRAETLHVYGLVSHMEREYVSQPMVKWISYLAPKVEGAKHPAGRGLTDRLIRAHRCTARACSAHLGCADSLPALVTCLPNEAQELLQRLHALSDWVVTVDRNAGVEFFDSPRDNATVYDTYVIDCVPERNDLGNMRMVTSTTRIDEVRDIFDEMLGSMGLSSSRRNCDFLIRALKGLSGRLAMRMTTKAARSEELIALALVYDNCRRADSAKMWLPLKDGFLVPVDDIMDLLPGEAPVLESPGRQVRSDLVYVNLGPRRNGLSFTFIEVKYRRHLRDARSSQTADYVREQAESFRDRFHKWYFESGDHEPIMALRRARLSRALRFYADKASRHDLPSERHKAILREIDRLVTQLDANPIAEIEHDARGFVFCPEYIGADPFMQSVGDGTVCIFGPAHSYDLEGEVSLDLGPNESQAMSTDSQNSPTADVSDIDDTDASKDTESNPGAIQLDSLGYEPVLDEPLITKSTESDQESSSPQSSDATEVVFGSIDGVSEPATWQISSRTNPHLMIAGLSGMGKTEVLLNICSQLQMQNIVPIVFSYHSDIDERLQLVMKEVSFLNYRQMGFNPMLVNPERPQAHIDNASQLRDVFSAIWPDLGEVQLGELRNAIKGSYEDAGWIDSSNGLGSVPEFSAFYRKLKKEERADRGLKTMLSRLDELNDYGIFDNHDQRRSLLDTTVPCVIQLHENDNEVLQRATAMLTLHRLYGDMFRRGPQSRLTHAIIVDEAHRAAKLKLLGKFAKEGRKFGLSLILASQAANDFDQGLFSSIASYLLLRMNEQDAYRLSREIARTDQAREIADRLKQLDKYCALFFSVNHRRPSLVHLSQFLG